MICVPTKRGPATRERPGPWHKERELPMHEQATQRPRRVRVERGIYKSPATGGHEIQYTDSTGRVRWQRVQGGLREARYARAEIQARLGRGELIARGSQTLREV